MRYQGSLVEWNVVRGFGFVRQHGQPDSAKVFAHVSAFPRNSRPAVGDIVTYRVERDERGRLRAVEIAALSARLRAHGSQRRTAQQTAGRVRGVLAVAVLLALGLAGWQRYGAQRASSAALAPEPTTDDTTQAPRVPVAAVDAHGFSCQGKRSCPEMTSCAEATFYLRECPGALSDGDGDGIPCEDQWCGH